MNHSISRLLGERRHVKFSGKSWVASNRLESWPEGLRSVQGCAYGDSFSGQDDWEPPHGFTLPCAEFCPKKSLPRAWAKGTWKFMLYPRKSLTDAQGVWDWLTGANGKVSRVLTDSLTGLNLLRNWGVIKSPLTRADFLRESPCPLDRSKSRINWSPLSLPVTFPRNHLAISSCERGT